MTACSKPPWWSAEAAHPGQINGSAGRRLSLYKPADQTILRGETSTMSIVIGKDNFEADVPLKIDQLPEGVSVVEKTVIPGGKDRLVVTLYAKPDAKLVENWAVRVTASGPDRLAASEVFLLTVKDRAGATPADRN